MLYYALHNDTYAIYMGLHLYTHVDAYSPIYICCRLQTFRVTIYQTALSDEGWHDDMGSGQYGGYHSSEGSYLTNQDPVIEEVQCMYKCIVVNIHRACI